MSAASSINNQKTESQHWDAQYFTIPLAAQSAIDQALAANGGNLDLAFDEVCGAPLLAAFASVQTATAKPKLKCVQCSVENQTELMQRCSRCKVAIYCDRDCQTKHWTAHKVECKSTSKVGKG